MSDSDRLLDEAAREERIVKLARELKESGFTCVWCAGLGRFNHGGHLILCDCGIAEWHRRHAPPPPTEDAVA